jgi:flagellar assembly protein FliH
VVVRQYHYVPTHATVRALVEEIAPGDQDDRNVDAPGSNPPDSAAKVAAMVAAGRTEVEALRQAAASEAERLRREAQQEGYADGYQTGFAEGAARAEATTAADVAAMHQIVEQLIVERQRLLSETESDLVGLALAISQKVIGDLASSCSAVILHLAARAVDVLGNPDAYEVHVSPQDYDMVNKTLAESGVSRTWSLVMDEHVTPGGCMVRHAAAQVDARPQAQLALVHKAFDELSTEARSADLAGRIEPVEGHGPSAHEILSGLDLELEEALASAASEAK